MADLLECLIQIKALGESLGMVTLSSSAKMSPKMETVTISDLWRRMADAERHYAHALGTEPGARPEIAAPHERAAVAREEFVARRRSNLATLNGCTAAQLAGSIEWPGRPSTTVADLVAIMLAYDTEMLGEVRRASRTEP